MNVNSYWRLCENFTLIQSILLFLGIDPENHDLNDFISNSYNGGAKKDKPDGFDAVYTAFKGAIMDGKIDVRVECEFHYGNETHLISSSNREEFLKADYYRFDKCLIPAQEIRTWLMSKGVRKGFFFENEDTVIDNVHNRNHKFYSPKLSAALYAWMEFTQNEEPLKNKSPKQAIETWLRKNAERFGLTKDDGNPNELGIEEICKVVNWKPQGGANPANVKNEIPNYEPLMKVTPLKKISDMKNFSDNDDDIPF